jgi:hypothetical protein
VALPELLSPPREYREHRQENTLLYRIVGYPRSAIRQGVTMGLIVAIGIKDVQYIKGDGHVSRDRLPDIVGKFLKKASLPNPLPFASVACGMDRVPSACRIYAGDGGVVALLKLSRVVDGITLASHEDIQNVAYNGWTKNKVHSYAKRIHDLSAKTFEERLRTLESVARNASSSGYAEARVARPLVLEDVEGWAD